MSKDTIYREDAIKAAEELNAISFYELNEHSKEAFVEIRRALKALPSADRPQGYWIKTDVATYRCSECGKIQYADDENELNYCCCCGSHNKIRKVIGDHNE